MKFKAFLLDQWIQQNSGAEFHLGGSTGPRWTTRELLALERDATTETMLDLKVTHPPTSGSLGLREAIAEMQGVSAEEVIVMAGSAEALFHIFYLAALPGANILVPFPCFSSYEAIPESFGFEIRHYQLPRKNSYRVDVDEVKSLADSETKILVVNSPHNPTGATLNNEEMRQLHDFCAERGIQFVSDEVFHPIYHGRETDSAARLTHATVVGDFSKALALPGLRLGWIIERDRSRRHEYLNAREYVSVSNTPMGEFLGEIVIRHRDKVWGRTREVAGFNLKLLYEVMTENADVVDWVRPQGGMTAFARPAYGANGRAFCQAALERGLLLAPGDCWNVPDHFRIGFGVGREWYPQAMERFAEFLGAWCRVAQASIS
ncbi:MAG: pyridoxal phosphate-dependent aminotransferase [Candidatus Acidiferrales bacterium]